jgi:CubicO group peptidase (beta-lactamase class C family)
MISFFFYNPARGVTITVSHVRNTSKELLIYHNRRAGYLVEKLSGMGFGEFLRTRLFEPLGMRDTAFWVPSDQTVSPPVIGARSGPRSEIAGMMAERASIMPIRRGWNWAAPAWFRWRTTIWASAA